MSNRSSGVIGGSYLQGDREIDIILSYLSREDMIFLKKLKKKRRNTGIIVALIGTGIFIGATYYYLISNNPTQSFLWIFFGWIIAMSIIREGTAMINEASKVETVGAGKYTVRSRIECVKCGYSEVRPFKHGDYVGKLVDDKCRKCEGPMKVTMIFAEPERKIKTVGMPLLPGMGGMSRELSLTQKLWLYLSRLIPPYGLYLRYVNWRKRDKNNLERQPHQI